MKIGKIVQGTMNRATRLGFICTALILIFAATAFGDPSLPKAQGFVNDFAGKLSPPNNQQIERLVAFEHRWARPLNATSTQV